jgi:hypothetical protein
MMSESIIFKINSADPKSHIEVCSVIDFFQAEIIKEKFGDQDGEFYGQFIIEGSMEAFEILSSLPGVTLYLDPENTLR